MIMPQSHPVANLFPLLEGKELEQLAEDIKANGQREHCTTWQGKLLDGRNRWRACEMVGKEPHSREFKGDEAQAIALVVSLNLRRRHLDASQRAMLGAELQPIFHEANKDRQIAGAKLGGQTAGRGRPKPSGTIAGSLTPRAEREARTQAAAAVNVSPRYVQEAKAIADPDTGAPDLAEKVKTGKLTIPKAKAELKARKRTMQREVAKAAAPKSVSFGTVECCAIEDLRIQPDSVDMIFTDPPYHKKSLPLYSELARLAASALKPGRFCVVYCGAMYLPEIMALFAPHLDYWWAVAVVHKAGGPTPRVQERRVNGTWRPVLIFRKRGKTDLDFQWIRDSVHAQMAKDDHDWQQDSETPEKLIAAYAAPGEIVLDPFAGGGTTAVVCVRLNRRFLTYDQNPEAVKTTLARIQEEGA